MELTLDTRKLRRRVRKAAAKLRSRASAKTHFLVDAVLKSKTAPTVVRVVLLRQLN